MLIKIEDYTETTTFSGIDMNAFGKNPTRMNWEDAVVIAGKMVPYWDMKDYNNHAISKKQQENF